MFTSASLIESLRQLRLLDGAQLDEARQLAAGLPEPRMLAAELSRRGWLTAFQVRMLVQERAQQLVLGPYFILEKLGEGGMGAVYKARDSRLDRVVAIKLLRREKNTNPDTIRRFRREVEVASSLSHPNVVRALDANEVDGTLVFEMEYIEGINLTQLVTKRGPLPVPMASDFMRQTALGLQHAHEKGLVHRDIKPSNLVVTRSSGPPGSAEASPNGVVKLLDMGLALILPDAAGQEKTRLTQLGKVVGTTDFLAPEQARNSHGVDIRADLYSLGCTFYFLLTARVPFPEGAPMEKLLKHQFDDPEPVDKLRPEMPPGLVPIVRKLMAKKPENRYQTPAEVAALLEPFAKPSSKSTAAFPVVRTSTTVPTLPPMPPRVAAPPPLPPVAPSAGNAPPAPMAPAAARPPAAPALPVPAPRPTPAPAPPAAVAAVAVLERSTPPADSITQPEPDSDPFINVMPAPPARPPAGKRSVWFSVAVLLALGGLGAAGFFVWQRDQSPGPGKRPDPAAEKIPPPKGAESWSLDQLPLKRVAGQPKELVALLGDPRQRLWGPVGCVAWSSDGLTVAVGGNDGFIRIWDADTGKEETYLVANPGRVLALAYQADRTLVSVHHVGQGTQVRTWNPEAPGGGPAILLEKKFLQPTAAAVSPEGDRVALALRRQDGTNEILVINVESGEQVGWATDKVGVSHLAFSPGGNTLAGAADKAIKLWDRAGKEVGSLPGHDQAVSAIAFARGGKALLSSSVVLDKGQPVAGEIKVWDVPSKSLKSTEKVPGPVQCLARDARGELVAWGFNRGNDHRVTVWDAVNNREKAALAKLETAPRVLAFSPDGRSLASVGDDQALRHWNLETRKEILPAPPPFRGRIAPPVVSPDGQSVAFLTWTGEQHAVVWDLVGNREKVLPRQKGGRFGQSLAFVADGKTLACSAPNVALFWSLSTGEELKPFTPPAGSSLLGPVSPDGHNVVVTGKDAVKLWDPITGKEGVALKDGPNGILSAAEFSPDGKLVALAGQPAAVVRLFDTVTGEEKRALTRTTAQIGLLAFSADGRLLAAVGRDGSVRVWECATGKEACKGIARGGVSFLSFTGNGAYLVLWGPRMLSVVDVANGKERVLMGGPDANLSAVAVSPVGQSLAFVTTEGWLYQRDAAAPREEQGTKIELPGPAQGLAFSADGRHLITANGNGTLYVLRPE
jgi:serine/threonine protein kinase/WD40 repeat protein